MRLLLDTHALIWSLNDSPRLGSQARDLIADGRNEVWVSTVSFWELAIKRRAGKSMEVDLPMVLDVLPVADFRVLYLKPAHAQALDRLQVVPGHRDPFDHMLVAQAIAEDLVLMTTDRYVPRYPVSVVPCC